MDLWRHDCLLYTLIDQDENVVDNLFCEMIGRRMVVSLIFRQSNAGRAPPAVT